MQTEAIEIPIEALDNASKKVDAITQKFANFSKEMTKQTQSYNAVEKQKQAAMAASNREAEKQATLAQKQKMSLTDLYSATRLVQQGFQAIKKGYDFAREGAMLDFTTIKFDRLSQTIGTTGEALLEKLRPATRGVMSDMELIGSATDTMSLGLVKNEKDAIRLTTVMAGLGMDMNQVVLALSNQTTMRFDQLGVAVAGFDEKVNALKATGMDASSAFTEAFLQQSEEQLAKVGHAADTTAGSFMQLEAQWKNFSDSLKMGAAEGLAPALAGINENVTAAQDYYKTLDKVSESTGLTVRQLRKMGEEELKNVMMKYEQNAENTRHYDETLLNLNNTLEETSVNYEMLLQLAPKLTDANAQYIQQTGELRAGIQDQAAAIQHMMDAGWSPNNKKIREQIDNLREMQHQLNATTEAQIQSGNDIVASMLEQAGASDQQQLDFALASGQITEDAYRQASAFQAIADAIANGMGADEAAAAVRRVIRTLNQLDGMSVEAYVNLIVNGEPQATTFGGGGGAGGYKTTAGHPPSNNRNDVSLEQASGGYGLSGMGIGDVASVGEMGEEGIVRTPRGLYVIPASRWRSMKTGGVTPRGGFMFGGEIEDPWTIQAGSGYQSWDKPGGGGGGGGKGGGSSADVVTDAIVTKIASRVVSSSTSQQAAVIASNNAQIAASMAVVNQLKTLIGVVSTNDGIARAFTNQTQKWSNR